MNTQTVSRILLLVIVAALILLSLSACGSSRKVVTKSTVDSTVTTTTAKQTETTVKEKADTNVTIKGDTAQASKPLDNFIAGDTLESDNNGTRLKMWYNPSTKRVHGEAITEPRTVAITIDRETTTKANEQAQTEAQVSKTETHKDIKKSGTPWYATPYPWLCLILLVVVGYFLWRYTP